MYYLSTLVKQLAGLSAAAATVFFSYVLKRNDCVSSHLHMKGSRQAERERKRERGREREKERGQRSNNTERKRSRPPG
jgi:hypothetical protein